MGADSSEQPMAVEDLFPKKGFYYGFRRGTDERVNHEAYQVIGTAKHLDTGGYLVVMKPLFKSPENDQCEFLVWPLYRFTGHTRSAKKPVPNYTEITDKSIIETLKAMIKSEQI